MASANNLMWWDRESRWLETNGAQLQAECGTFFKFPNWYPNGVQEVYKNLLWILLAHFRQQGMDTFSRRAVRGLINYYKREIVKTANDPNKGPYDDPEWRELMGGFSFLERNIILELVRLEYAAGLPEKDGLEYIADKNTFYGRAIQKQRSDKGKKSGVVRRELRKEEDQKIVAYAETLRTNGIDRNQWARRASKEFDVSIPTVRRAIKAAGCYDFLSSLKQKKVIKKRAIQTKR